MDNQLAFEAVLSRRLEELRAELMGIYTQHLTRGNQDMPTVDMEHQEQQSDSSPRRRASRGSETSSLEYKGTSPRFAYG